MVRRGNMVVERRIIGSEDLSVLNDKKFHERSKKATVHCVGQASSLHIYFNNSSILSRFGPEMARPTSLMHYHLIPNNDPELIFVFKYQPLGIAFYPQVYR